MTKKRTVLLGLFIVCVAGLGYVGFAVYTHGFSAREKPSALETILARHARRIATPSDAKNLRNLRKLDAGTEAEAMEHFAAHCAICHAIDGKGDTVIGRNLYPKASDLTDRGTQELTDGELYYIISNGVRFTGMPAMGGEDSPESIWDLVALIRKLPSLSPDERRQMEQLAAGGKEDKKESGEEGAPKPHVHSHDGRPHTH